MFICTTMFACDGRSYTHRVIRLPRVRFPPQIARASETCPQECKCVRAAQPRTTVTISAAAAGAHIAQSRNLPGTHTNERLYIFAYTGAKSSPRIYIYRGALSPLIMDDVAGCVIPSTCVRDVYFLPRAIYIMCTECVGRGTNAGR